MDRWIICAGCGNKLGERVAGQVAIRYRGREILGAITAIRCESCGEVSDVVARGESVQTGRRARGPRLVGAGA